MIREADPFTEHMEAVARKLLGEPNAHLSSAAELRFGSHGSLSVDLEKGTYFDHEAEKGGGVLALLDRERGLKGKDAIEWLRQEVGAHFEEREPPRQERARPKSRIVETYDYIDEAGEVLFQVCRMEPKDFRQRCPDGAGGWSWSVKGVRQVPFRLHEIKAAIARGETIYVCEGEKDALNGAKEGLATTCNAGGAGKWPAELTEHFRGADVVILPHNDQAGRNHVGVVSSALRGVAARVRYLELPDLGPKGDLSDWLAMGGDREQLVDLQERYAKAWTPERPQSRFGAIPFNDIDGVSIKQDWLVEDLIFCGDVGMVYGASGSGKSFLTVDMGLSIARGVPFLGKKTRKGAVLYQAGEGGKGLVKRMKAYRQEHNVTGDVPFVLLPERVDLFAVPGEEERDLNAFLEECMAWKAWLSEPLAMIVIDTFSTASAGANENASEDMSRLIRAGETINKATGAALIWVHHKNAAGDRERGHTSLRANIDTAIEVTKDEDSKVRTARLVKLKDGEDGLRLGFELHPVTVGTYDDGKEITSCVVTPAQVETERASVRYLPKGQANFLKVLSAAIAQYGGQIPGDDQWGVDWDHFRDLYRMVCGAGKEPGAIRTALSRDGDALWRADLIGRHDRWLWITDNGKRHL